MVTIIHVSNAASPGTRRLKWRPSVDGRGGMLEVQTQGEGSDVWNTLASARLSATQTTNLIDALAPNAVAAYRVAVAGARGVNDA